MLKNIDSYADRVKTEIALELTDTGINIEREAKQKAPVDLGNLRQRIVSTKESELKLNIGSGANYSAYVEFGTGGLVDIPTGPGLEELSEYAIQFKGRGVRQVNLPARPFFFPAVSKFTSQLLPNIKKILEQG